MSTISSTTILNRFNIKEVGSLKEEVINLGMNEAWKTYLSFHLCMFFSTIQLTFTIF